MPLNTIKPTRLDSFLRQMEAEPKEIFFKTSITEGKLSHLRNCRANIYVYDFYLIATSLSTDLNEMAERVFADYQKDIDNIRETRKSGNKGEYGKFGQIIQKYLNSQSTLATLIGMDKHKFGRVLYADSEMIALDLYFICKVLDLDFKTVMNEVCHHLNLNTEKEQQTLKEEHKAYLASLKLKRDESSRRK